MTPSELKYAVEATGKNQHFFDRKTMKFFGDTMKNFGCRRVEIDGRQLWELYRKKLTNKYQLRTVAYFDCETFHRVNDVTKAQQ